MDFLGLWNTFNGGDRLFLMAALAGTLLFFLQWVLLACGFTSSEMTTDLIGDLPAFHWVSIQTLSGFTMFFGWSGLAWSRQFSFSFPLALALSVCCGGIVILIHGFLLKNVAKLRSQGSSFSLERTLGTEALVYHKISQGAVGTISVHLDGIGYEIDAVSEEEEIPSFTKVKILKIHNEKTLLVTIVR